MPPRHSKTTLFATFSGWGPKPALCLYPPLPPAMTSHPNTILTVFHCFRCWRTIVRPKTWPRMHGGGNPHHHSAMAASRKDGRWEVCFIGMAVVGDRDYYITAFMVGGEDAVWELCKADTKRWLRQAEEDQAKILATQTEGIARVLRGLKSSSGRSSRRGSTGAPKRPPGRRSHRRSR